MYQFKEMFLTLQGEGALTGRRAVFARFSGCNLWSGREVDRAGAMCSFCDTDFVGTDGQNGGKFATAKEVVAQLEVLWGEASPTHRFVVFTGGEPLLQLDEALINEVKKAGFFIAVETNGTIKAPSHLDWICVSPKAQNALKQTSGHELKLVWPQKNLDPAQFVTLDFAHFILQPMDNADQKANIAACLAYCLAHPCWRLGLQTHKIIGID